MATKIYLVRHAKPDLSIHDDFLRPLSSQGLMERKKVTDFLMDKNISKVYSSPYKRAIDTIEHFAEQSQLSIQIIDDFRERKVSDRWIEDFNSFCRNQWSDFEYKLENGESLSEVQKRNIQVLKLLIKKDDGDNIIIGSHGTAISTVLHYFNNRFNYDDFARIKDIMPSIVCLTFNGDVLKSIDEYVFE